MRRYEPILKIASGGTATVYVGAAAGDLGFRQLVAIKRPHAHLAEDVAFRAALLDEAQIAARIRHANVVDVRDVEADEQGIQLVMDWVEGASLSDMIRSWCKERPENVHAVALRIVLDACEGLRAVHELAGDDGKRLGLVHRDISPANILVGLDGVGRITDFGLAKPLAVVERTTSEGTLRGKLGYMAPEYVKGGAIDERVDVFAMGVVLYEALARKRLFRGENDAETLDRVQHMDPPRLTSVAPELGVAAGELDGVVSRALAKAPDARYPSIEALVKDVERVARAHDLHASHADVRASFGSALKAELEERRKRVQDAIKSGPHSSPPSALWTTGSTSWQPPPVAPSSPPPSVSPTMASVAPASAADTAAAVITAAHPPSVRAASPARWVALAVFAFLVVGGGIAGATVAFRSPAPPVVREAHAAASDLQTRDDAPRGRDAPDAPAVRASSPIPARPPAPEPGNKPPRPNPYKR